MRGLAHIIVKENPGNAGTRAGADAQCKGSSCYVQCNGRGRAAQVK
jgi:hypothetical protein